MELNFIFINVVKLPDKIEGLLETKYYFPGEHECANHLQTL
jgi:hypothetical protein